ncbi:cytosol non-specific dipeptidase [Limosilactobacillus coleohominis DSM 14060]|nr:cytosol non-specific dipeptidase [Limosilactobacillus coleohominis DSM 14060]
MYWMTQLIATIADDHPKRYQMSLENLRQNTMAAGRNVMIKTDQKVAKLSGTELQKQLQEANNETAKRAYDLAMKCLGGMVENGALKLHLNYGNE